MKKHLLLFFTSLLLCSINLIAQTCGTGAPKVYTDLAQYPNGAPITIGESTGERALDWRTQIVGNYSGDVNNPYLAPIYPNNIQKDKLAVEGDLDASGIDANGKPNAITEPGRDLRFFAFTYDRKNVYFYFLRPATSNAQISVFYYIDINGDGFLRNGEPVIKVTVQGNTATPVMMYYTASTTAAGYDPIKGNIMVSPVTGLADGHDMPGNITEVTNLTTLSTGEKYIGASTDGGKGWEFAIPFSYLKLYGNGNTGINQLTYDKFFTWHVALDNGNSYLSNGLDDNAGGCCGGTAASGAAKVNLQTPIFDLNGSLSKYRFIVPYQEQAGAVTNISLNEVYFNNLISGSNTVDATSFVVKVSKDINKDNIADVGTTQQYFYNSGGGTYLISNPTIVNTAQNGNGQFIVEVDFVTPNINSITANFKIIAQIANTNDCEITSDDIKISSAEIKFSVLPVNFQSFTVARNPQKKEQVLLKWQTASEQNNRGFYVQRKVAGQWKNIAFVFSQAENGNSNTTLAYEYKDNNVSNTVTQYQIQQVDLDGKTSYSDIKSVIGMDQKSSVVIYPNPATDGKIKLVFSNQDKVIDVVVSDMSGRVVKQYRQLAESNLTVEGLKTGFYTIKITDHTAGTTTVEKVIIK